MKSKTPKQQKSGSLTIESRKEITKALKSKAQTSARVSMSVNSTRSAIKMIKDFESECESINKFISSNRVIPQKSVNNLVTKVKSLKQIGSTLIRTSTFGIGSKKYNDFWKQWDDLRSLYENEFTQQNGRVITASEKNFNTLNNLLISIQASVESYSDEESLSVLLESLRDSLSEFQNRFNMLLSDPNSVSGAASEFLVAVKEVQDTLFVRYKDLFVVHCEQSPNGKANFSETSRSIGLIIQSISTLKELHNARNNMTLVFDNVSNRFREIIGGEIVETKAVTPRPKAISAPIAMSKKIASPPLQIDVKRLSQARNIKTDLEHRIRGHEEKIYTLRNQAFMIGESLLGENHNSESDKNKGDFKDLQMKNMSLKDELEQMKDTKGSTDGSIPENQNLKLELQGLLSKKSVLEKEYYSLINQYNALLSFISPEFYNIYADNYKFRQQRISVANDIYKIAFDTLSQSCSNQRANLFDYSPHDGIDSLKHQYSENKAELEKLEEKLQDLVLTNANQKVALHNNANADLLQKLHLEKDKYNSSIETSLNEYKKFQKNQWKLMCYKVDRIIQDSRESSLGCSQEEAIQEAQDEVSIIEEEIPKIKKRLENVTSATLEMTKVILSEQSHKWAIEAYLQLLRNKMSNYSFDIGKAFTQGISKLKDEVSRIRELHSKALKEAQEINSLL